MDNENSGLLNLQWRHLWRLATCSWVAFFLSSLAAILIIWSNPKSLGGHLLMGAPLALAFAATLIPGATALLRAAIRARLFSMPTAAALSMFTLAFVISVVVLVLASVVANGSEVLIDSTGKDKPFPSLPSLAAYFFIGIVSFPLTFGMAFPLAIPLVCAIVVREKIRRRSSASPKFYLSMTALSILGWMLVTLAGIGLGNA